MERRDILKDEIERLGRALGKIIAEFFNQKKEGKVALGIETTNQQLVTQLDLDIDKLVNLENSDLGPYLSEKKFTHDHIELLVDYIIAMADHAHNLNPHRAITLYERALELYVLATRQSKIYPFERSIKEEQVRKKLKALYQDH